MIHLVKELKKADFYIIGGVNTHWLKDVNLVKFHPLYLELNMVQPWTVGRFSGVQGAKDYAKTIKEDHDFLKQHNIDYQVVVYAGFAWSNWNKNSEQNAIPRLHGEFMSQQFVNLRELGIRNAYVAMFDEYDEGTAIAKAAETKLDIPVDQYFLTLDADGVHVWSDFYLRLTTNGNRMIQGDILLQQNHVTSFAKH